MLNIAVHTKPIGTIESKRKKMQVNLELRYGVCMAEQTAAMKLSKDPREKRGAKKKDKSIQQQVFAGWLLHLPFLPLGTVPIRLSMFFSTSISIIVRHY